VCVDTKQLSKETKKKRQTRTRKTETIGSAENETEGCGKKEGLRHWHGWNRWERGAWYDKPWVGAIRQRQRAKVAQARKKGKREKGTEKRQRRLTQIIKARLNLSFFGFLLGKCLCCFSLLCCD
jgi:hypothetical protein